MHPLGAGGRSARVHFRPRPIKLVIIETPFPDVSRHVFDPKWTGTERKCADWRTFRITVVDVAVTPGKDGIPVSEVREIAAAVIISPWKFASIISLGGVLPFGFGRQAI